MNRSGESLNCYYKSLNYLELRHRYDNNKGVAVPSMIYQSSQLLNSHRSKGPLLNRTSEECQKPRICYSSSSSMFVGKWNVSNFSVWQSMLGNLSMSRRERTKLAYWDYEEAFKFTNMLRSMEVWSIITVSIITSYFRNRNCLNQWRTRSLECSLLQTVSP